MDARRVRRRAVDSAGRFELAPDAGRGRLLHVQQPEALEPGDVRRTTASASWLHGSTATSVVYGRNDKSTTAYNAFVAESTHTFGANAIYGRYEAVQVETDVLRFGTHDTGKLKRTAHVFDDLNRVDLVQALTLGGVRTVWRGRGWDLAGGGDVTAYVVPDALRPTRGESPVSFHLFMRLRPPARMGRMVEMTMIRSH